MKASFALLVGFLVVGSAAAAAQEGSQRASTHFELAAPRWADGSSLGEKSDEAFAVVADRLGLSIDEKVPVVFAPPGSGPCQPQGSAMVIPQRTEGDPIAVIQIFADEDTDQDQILGVLAHELGHVFKFVAIEGGRSLGTMFLEGFATWAAGPYWLQWQGATSFRSAVASYIAAGTYVPLHENESFFDTFSGEAVARFGQDCLQRRAMIYTEWAAFIEYLVAEYGRERLYSLFQTPPMGESDEEAPFGRPNYPAVYGASLEQLEAEWLESITAAN